MMMNRIALAQTEIVWEDKTKNILCAEELIEQAKNNRASFIFFPEMSFTGFTMNTEASAENDNYTVDNITKLAKKYHIGIGFGWVKKSNLAQNHYTIIDQNGVVISDYTKIHPFSFAKEDEYFESGNELTYFKIFNITCSNFICYDLRFPEIFQIVSKKSSIIFVPANWPKRRSEHWKILLRARAIENQVYIVAINCCGSNIGGLEYSGNSCVINPNGDILVDSDVPGIIYWDVENDVEEFRKNFPIKKDRQEGLYHKLRL